MNFNISKIEFFFLFLILMLSFFLRIYGLDRSLWLDEVFSFNSQMELQRHISNIYEPMHLYFVILNFFMFFGTNEIMVRLPSFVFGVFSIFLIFQVGKILFGRSKDSLIAAFLLSISTMHIQHSQESRYYSLTTFLTLLSFFFFYSAINKKSKKIWILYVFSTVFAILSHWYMILIVPIQLTFFVFLIIKNKNYVINKLKKLNKRKISFLVIGLIVFFVGGILIFQRALPIISSGEAFMIRSWGLQTSTFFQDLFSFFTFGYSFSFLSYLYGNPLDLVFFSSFLLFFSIGIIATFMEKKEIFVLLILWIFLPSLSIFVLSFIIGPFAIARYLMFILPGYLLLISRGIIDFSEKFLLFFGSIYFKIVYGLSSIPLLKQKKVLAITGITAIILVSLAGILFIPLQMHYKSPADYENWKDATKYLSINVGSDDLIIVEPEDIIDPLIYYYEKDFTNADFMKNITTSISSQNLEYPFQYFLDLISKHYGAWIVISPRHSQYVNPAIMRWIETNSIEIKKFAQVTIFYYQEDLTFISTRNMRFEGLDDLSEDFIAVFWDNNDLAKFDITVNQNKYYSIALHAKKGYSESYIKTSAIELIIDEESKSNVTFKNENWSFIQLGTSLLTSGSHEIKLVIQRDNIIADSSVIFDKIAIWSKQ